MSIWSSYGTDKSLETEGRWLQFRPDDNGQPIRVKVRSTKTTKADAIRSKYFSQFRHIINSSATIPADLMEGLNVVLCRDWVVADWENVSEPDGTPIPCTPANVERVMAELRSFRDEVLEVAGLDLTFKQAGASELGNSSRPTSGAASDGVAALSPSPSKPESDN